MGCLKARCLLGGLALLCAACATLAEAETGGENLPNAGAGPFRALRPDEVGNLRSAPNVLVDDETFPRDPALLDADGDPSTPDVFGYFAITPNDGMTEPDPSALPRAIVRYGAQDGRSFDRSPTTVLVPEEAWEGSTMGAPAAIRVGAEVFLYYTAEGGIGLARSDDGLTFVRVSGPILGPDPNGWEGGQVPASPGVVRLDDGSFRMFYEVAGDGSEKRIGEARSDDGVAWQRVGDAPVLAPRMDVNLEDPFYDGVAVFAPFPVLGKSAEGRSILRVYYGGRDALGRMSIGLAARYDPASGALERAATPVFGGSLGPSEPCVEVRPGYSLLFVTQLEGRTKSEQIPAIAAAVSPADAVLPAPFRP
ncbi:MAG: hypothetical protein IPM54_28370 [Polyangiaceae bacterium]|nr:hypothetical protein [Polyangiaceae bacterium]